jgi:hypothetical protein
MGQQYALHLLKPERFPKLRQGSIHQCYSTVRHNRRRSTATPERAVLPRRFTGETVTAPERNATGIAGAQKVKFKHRLSP